MSWTQRAVHVLVYQPTNPHFSLPSSKLRFLAQFTRSMIYYLPPSFCHLVRHGFGIYMFCVCLAMFRRGARDFSVYSRSRVVISKHDFPFRYVTVSIFSCFTFNFWCL